MEKIKTAILGGSFNPIHNAHIKIAKYVCKKLEYDRIIFIPSYISPHKAEFDYIKPIDRFNMASIAISNYSNFIIEDYEIKQECVSYTINTIEYIYTKYKDIKGTLGLIVGSDLIADFNKWHKADDIAKCSDIIAISRTDNTKIENPNITKYNINLMYINYINISSTIIRDNINNENLIKNMLDTNVYKYIKDNNLYKN